MLCTPLLCRMTVRTFNVGLGLIQLFFPIALHIPALSELWLRLAYSNVDLCRLTSLKVAVCSATHRRVLQTTGHRSWPSPCTKINKLSRWVPVFFPVAFKLKIKFIYFILIKSERRDPLWRLMSDHSLTIPLSRSNNRWHPSATNRHKGQVLFPSLNYLTCVQSSIPHGRRCWTCRSISRCILANFSEPQGSSKCKKIIITPNINCKSGFLKKAQSQTLLLQRVRFSFIQS